MNRRLTLTLATGAVVLALAASFSARPTTSGRQLGTSTPTAEMYAAARSGYIVASS